jgi:hypothetical protein
MLNTFVPAAPACLQPRIPFSILRPFPTFMGCMAPDYLDGSRIKISKTEPYEHGDIVAVWLRPDVVQAGSLPAMIKRIAMIPPLWVKAFPYKHHPKSDVLALLMLAQNDRPDQLLRVRCADVIAIHKVVGLLAPEASYKAPRDHFMRKMPRRKAVQK